LPGGWFRPACPRPMLGTQGAGDAGSLSRPIAMNGLPRMAGAKAFSGAAAAVLLMAYAGPSPVLADTIEAALVRAYQNNPQLNAQRAQARVADENVPQALSGYRPTLSVTSTLGEAFTQEKVAGGPGGSTILRSTTTPWTVGVNASQTLFNGFQTANRTRAAE